MGAYASGPKGTSVGVGSISLIPPIIFPNASLLALSRPPCPANISSLLSPPSAKPTKPPLAAPMIPPIAPEGSVGGISSRVGVALGVAAAIPS